MLRYIVVRPVDLFIGLRAMMAVFWGVWIFVFSSFSSSPTFDVLAYIAPEWVYSIVLVGSGGAAVYGLRNGRIAVLRVSLFALSIFWILIATLAIAANFRSTASVVYPFVVLEVLYLWYAIGVRRLMRDG